MSCVGKTTFAKLIDRPYICFDYWFEWHTIETLSLPISNALDFILSEALKQDRFVIDGWHLAGANYIFPKDVCVIVLYASHKRIIDQYRVPITAYDFHRKMYDQWYQNDLIFDNIRFVENKGDFVETNKEEFGICCRRHW